MTDPQDRPLRIFITYAPEDRALANELLKHLRFLERQGKIEAWSIDRVQAGGDWHREVRKALEDADVSLLLLSVDFLNSEFIQDVEVPSLLERRVNQGLVIISIMLRTCLWEEEPRIGGLKPLPAGGKAIAAYEGDARDQVMTEVAKEIARIAKENRQNTSRHDNRSDQRNPNHPSQQGLPPEAHAGRSPIAFSVQGFFYQVRLYLYDAKTSEAKNTLGAIVSGLLACVEREDEHGRRAERFPPSAPPTPPDIPRGVKAVPDENTWSHPTWGTIKFSMSSPVYLSYEVDTSPDGRTAVARARGDLGGDGKIIIFERTVSFGPDGNAVASPEVITREAVR